MDGVIGIPPPKPVAMNAPPPKGVAGISPPPPPPPPKIDTKSSSGLLDVPARRLAAAGVLDSTSVAARPDGWPSNPVASSKSLDGKNIQRQGREKIVCLDESGPTVSSRPVVQQRRFAEPFESRIDRHRGCYEKKKLMIMMDEFLKATNKREKEKKKALTRHLFALNRLRHALSQ